MRDLSTLLGSKVATSININGVYYPANSIGKAIVSYVDPAIFNCEDWAPYSLSMAGTSFRLKYKGRFFAFCTQHQLSNSSYDYPQFVVANRDHPKQRFCSSEKAVFDRSGKQDLCLFEFTGPVKAGVLPDHIWFDASKHKFEVPTPAAEHCFCVGYPGQYKSLDYESLHFDYMPCEVSGAMCKPGISNRLAFKPQGNYDFSFSGLSGSPVFGVRINQLEPKIFLAGILANSSKYLCNFIPAKFVLKFLKHATNEDSDFE